MFLKIFLLVAIGNLVFYVPALVFSLQKLNLYCLSESTIFTYSTWLFWFGTMGILYTGILATLSLVDFFVGEKLTLSVLKFTSVIYCLWRFAWWIVGGILLFQTVIRYDCIHEPIGIFGFTLFILETITYIFFTCCFLKRVAFLKQ